MLVLWATGSKIAVALAMFIDAVTIYGFEAPSMTFFFRSNHITSSTRLAAVLSMKLASTMIASLLLLSSASKQALTYLNTLLADALLPSGCLPRRSSIEVVLLTNQRYLTELLLKL